MPTYYKSSQGSTCETSTECQCDDSSVDSESLGNEEEKSEAKQGIPSEKSPSSNNKSTETESGSLFDAAFASLPPDPLWMTNRVVSIKNFIGNEFVPPISGSFIESFNPGTGVVWAKIPDSEDADVQVAVLSARAAFFDWSQSSVQFRSRVLLRIADGIESRLDELAEIESRDQGKPVSLAKTVDIPRCVHNFRFFATTILHDTNESIVQEEPCKAVNYVVKKPVGVAGLISPWNLPLYLLSFKIAPAIAAGNTVVAKPSELTSVTAWLLAHIFIEAGLPPGVVNLVFGTGPKAGEALVCHPQVPLISFTGSTATGRKIAQICASMNKKVSLEMGGKNACIVFEDADLDKAVPTILRSSFANQGEICLCSSRIFVQRPVFDEFTKRFVEGTEKLKVVHPLQEGGDMGPLVSLDHFNKVKGFRDLAEREGKILTGLEPIVITRDIVKQGYYFRPTVVVDVDDKSALMQEEIFGPLVCIVPFDRENEVIHRANNVRYGLSASLWSKDVSRIHRVAHKLDVGTVWCNCWLVRELNMPFGGMKESGMGREGAKDSLDFFTEKRTICIKID